MLVFLSRPFSLDHFDDYQKHYTVMNYTKDVQLKQVQKLCLGYMLRSVRLISHDQCVCFPSDSLWWIYPYVWEPVSTVSMETGWGMALCTSNFPYSGPVVKYSQDWYTYTDFVHSFLFVSYTVFPLQISLPNSSVYERFKVPLQSMIVSNKTHLW